MPRGSNGTYVQPGGTAAVSGAVISSVAFNTLETDIGSEITNSLDRLGRGAMQAPLNLGGHQINSVTAGVLLTDAANVGQLGSLGGSTRLAAAASSIPAAASIIYVSGYATAGDGGEAAYTKLSAAPGSPTAANFQTEDGAWWQLSSPFVYPQMVAATGTSDDSAALTAASIAAVAIEADLVINIAHEIANAVTFGAPVRFLSNGRITCSGANLVTFQAGFDAPLHAQIFNFSTSGSGLAAAEITARVLTPQMFGAVENSPSSATANAAAFNLMGAAWLASGVDVDLTPNTFYLGAPVKIDYGGSAVVSGNFRGRGAKTVLDFNAGVHSPNLQFTDASGSYDSGGYTRSEFYGEISDFQVWGSPIVQSTGYSVGGVTMQFGEQAFVGSGPSAGDTLAYLNGISLKRLVIKNNQAYSGANTGGGYGLFLSGLTTFGLDLVTSNAGGAANDGSAAIVMQACSYGVLTACSTGNAAYGIWSPTGYSGTNQTLSGIVVHGHDFEVLGVAAIGNRSTQFQNNKFQGGFANMPYLLDCPYGQGNEIDNSLIGGVTTGIFTNAGTPTSPGALNSYGALGFTLRLKDANFIGATVPYGTLSLPTLTANTWFTNTYLQDAIAYISCQGTFTINKRAFNDRSSGGIQIYLGGTASNWTTVPIPWRSGESLEVVTTAAVAWVAESRD